MRRLIDVRSRFLIVSLFVCSCAAMSWAQLTDRTQAPNASNTGIAKSLPDETGAGRGDANTWGSSIFIIERDPFRSIRRGRQLFQRKFTRLRSEEHTSELQSRPHLVC